MQGTSSDKLNLNKGLFVGLVAVPLVSFLGLNFFQLNGPLPVVFGIVVGGLCLICGFYLGSQQKDEEAGALFEELNDDNQFERELDLFAEAAGFFSATLKEEEMISLLSARIAELFTGCTVGIVIPSGEEDFDFSKTEIPSAPSIVDLVGVASRSEGVVTGKDLARKSVGYEIETAAIRLKRGGEVIGVLVIIAGKEGSLPSDVRIEQVATVSSPLISGAKSFEASASNALTDTLTALPNLRALNVVLGHQVAEAERYAGERKLFVMAVDINGFDSFNLTHGHSEGDRMLAYLAKILCNQLRKMDYVARIGADEFVVVMPNAGLKSAEGVIARIEEACRQDAFETRSGNVQVVVPNFGVSTCEEDGYESERLVSVARERKSVSKIGRGGGVLLFPKRNSGQISAD